MWPCNEFRCWRILYYYLSHRPVIHVYGFRKITHPSLHSFVGNYWFPFSSWVQQNNFIRSSHHDWKKPKNELSHNHSIQGTWSDFAGDYVCCVWDIDGEKYSLNNIDLKVLFVLLMILNVLMIWMNLWRRIEERRQRQVEQQVSESDSEWKYERMYHEKYEIINKIVQKTLLFLF